MINIKNLVHRYAIWDASGKKSQKEVLKDLSLDIQAGEFVAILGPNGCGKSTLAKHLNVLLLPDEGTIWIDGKSTIDREKLWNIRTEVGMVFQNPDNQIVGTNVEEDVAFGPENKCLSSNIIQERVTNSLKVVGLLRKRKHSPTRLSGGQKQRVALAGVLASEPKYIVLDEPTAMLDPKSRKEVIRLIEKLNREKNITILLITHHTDEVIHADKIVLMKQGKIVKIGTPYDIFSDLKLIKEIKMDVPQVTELAYRLKKRGLPIPYPILEEDEFVKILKELYREKNGGTSL